MVAAVGGRRAMRERPCGVDGDRAIRRKCAGAEADGGPVAFADAAHAHHERGVVARLDGVQHGRRVAQRRTLDGRLVGEAGAEQHVPGARQVHVRVDACHDHSCVFVEHRAQVGVATDEALLHIGVGRLHFRLAEVEDALDDRCRAGVTRSDVFDAREEEARDDARVVWSQVDAGVVDERGVVHAMVANERARCIVDTYASVDSAPWLVFTPSTRNPS